MNLNSKCKAESKMIGSEPFGENVFLVITKYLDFSVDKRNGFSNSETSIFQRKHATGARSAPI